MSYPSTRWYTALLCLALAALACKTLAPASQPAQTQTPGAHRPLYSDDFSDPSSGWNRVTAERGQSDYADGVYRIFVDEPNVDIWSLAGQKFGNVSVEVDAYKVGGQRDNRFGLICRAISPDSFYAFIVSSDGYYGIGKIKGQEYRLIGMDALQPSDAIHQGSALNSLRADCNGDTLTLYANGVKLAEVKDSEFAFGDVGLIAGTYDTAGTDIRFDNFSVRLP
jgi:hypothetical protein